MHVWRHGRAVIATALFATLPMSVAPADEAAIVADMAAFRQTPQVKKRQALVARIQADPAYDRAKVSGWLHAAATFAPLPLGRHWLDVPLVRGGSRRVRVRIPAGYDPRRPWPLMYALHGMGGNADNVIDYLERVLGVDLEYFIVAAPDRYEEVAVHDPSWPPTGEHPAAWLKLRQNIHVDNDRVYLTGYSRGGHGVWTLAVLHADQFAGIVPIAGTFILPLGDALYETLLPNVANLPALAVWGEKDIYGPDGKVSPDGGICGVNRRLRAVAVKLKLPLVAVELMGEGHSGIRPPAEEFKRLLAEERRRYPRTVQHTFRHLYQGSAYWIEGHEWNGSVWGREPPPARMRPGESVDNDDDYRAAALRAYCQCLAELRGEVDGQTIRVQRKKVSEFTVWIGDDMIDWERPVRLVVSGDKAFEGRLEPDLYVCLAQAARTWDFDRLRWAGLRVRRSTQAEPVSATTEFPDLPALLKPRK